jgi:hypothetical protein
MDEWIQGSRAGWAHVRPCTAKSWGDISGGRAWVSGWKAGHGFRYRKTNKGRKRRAGEILGCVLYGPTMSIDPSDSRLRSHSSVPDKSFHMKSRLRELMWPTGSEEN